MNPKSTAASSLHSHNIRCNRAERDLKKLEEEYQAWLRRREERRQYLLAQLKKIQSPSRGGKFCSLNTVASLEDELEKMREEDNERADRERLDREEMLPFRKPAYKKLAFEIALEKNRKALQKANEERDAIVSQNKDKGKGKATPSEGEQDDNDGVRLRAAGKRTFGSKLDAAMAKGTTRKFGMNYHIVHDEFVTDGWQKNWGLHDVRACRYKYRSPEPEVEDSPEE
ncbi:hypothetical protein O181_061827 [Austropuccinia psidii MF-1]|uniref:Uncharacterized protein n=1 Tax=Austropuccinia psidii MF-1 TaxID=1389203 RepID=A0A9Q3ELH5_9BASI|nr:hypothetical protein [Austropuccinia psidii MF-1]